MHPLTIQYSQFLDNIGQEMLAALRNCFDDTEGMISFDEAVLLYFLAREMRDGCIMEIGAYRGRSSVFLGKGSLSGSNVPVYSIDPHKNFIGVLGGRFGPADRTMYYKAILSHGCSETVSLINLSSENFCLTWKEPISLLWIDGDHRYEGVLRDYECWERHLMPNAVIAFDDATDETIGPRKLINQLISDGKYDEVLTVGKITVIA